MKVLIVNPIIYTSETKQVKRADTIKDTMIYDLCLAFVKAGIDVTLAAAEPYKPTKHEQYPFKVEWMPAKCQKICFPNSLPYCPSVKQIAKNGNFDFIITSEVFSLNSLMLVRKFANKTIVWHELAKHNNMLHKIPSHIWYGIIARLFFSKATVVGRSEQARDFIKHYCKNTVDTVIDHGVNLDKFEYCKDKDNYFAVSSQLIPRKRINLTVDAFANYVKKYDSSTKLYIMGGGESRSELELQAKSLGIESNVVFTGKLHHNELIDILKKASAMLVYTEKDNSILSVVESIAVGTPVISTTVPYNSTYIKASKLGLVSDTWGADELNQVKTNNEYINNCINYRDNISTDNKVKAFVKLYNKNKV